MIDEKATKERFGYYSNELKPHSDKKIVSICDDCGKERVVGKDAYYAICRPCVNKRKHIRVQCICKQCGKAFERLPSHVKEGRDTFCSRDCRYKHRVGATLSEESRARMRKKHPSASGEKHIRWTGGGVERTCKNCNELFMAPKYKVKNGGGIFCSHRCFSEFNRGENCSSWKPKTKRVCMYCGKGFYVWPSVVAGGGGKYCSMSCGRKNRKFQTHHTKPEMIFEEICTKHNLPFVYVGDGAIWIGEKGNKQLNPDFIESHGKRVVVEVFGDYWHSPLLNYNLREDATFWYRKNHYKRFGWETIIIWENDLKGPNAEHFVLNQINKLCLDTSTIS